MPETLIVNEIYRSIQGEGRHAGRRCAIVRLAGCNLRCAWCDTTYAYDDGRPMPVADVVAAAVALACPLVMVTGGEPLIQAATPVLLTALCDAGCEVLIQTNGSLPIAVLDPRVARCVDVKCPGSGQAGAFLPANAAALRRGDEVNFVCADRADYDFTRRVMAEYDLPSRCDVFLTAAAGVLDPADLAAWIVADDALLPGVRLGLQWHKVLWPDARRGV